MPCRIAEKEYQAGVAKRNHLTSPAIEHRTSGPLRGPSLHAVASLPWSRRSCGVKTKPHFPFDVHADRDDLTVRTIRLFVPVLHVHSTVLLGEDVRQMPYPYSPCFATGIERTVPRSPDAVRSGGRVARCDDPAFRVECRLPCPSPAQQRRRQQASVGRRSTSQRDRVADWSRCRVRRRPGGVVRPRPTANSGNSSPW